MVIIWLIYGYYVGIYGGLHSHGLLQNGWLISSGWFGGTPISGTPHICMYIQINMASTSGTTARTGDIPTTCEVSSHFPVGFHLGFCGVWPIIAQIFVKMRHTAYCKSRENQVLKHVSSWFQILEHHIWQSSRTDVWVIFWRCVRLLFEVLLRISSKCGNV